MNDDIIDVVLHTRQVSEDGAHHLLKGGWYKCQSVWYGAEPVQSIMSDECC